VRSTLPPAPPAISPAFGGDDLDADALTLPAAWTAPPRQPLPIVAAFIPLIGAVALWLVTGSVLSLWLALLGPLIAVSSMFDARRAARRDRRRAAVEAARARERVSSEIERRHAEERRRLQGAHPDVARFVAREEDVWRAATVGATGIVVGEGTVTSDLRVRGGQGDPDAVPLRRRAGQLPAAPIVIPAHSGVVVTGPEQVASAVQRALVLQLCLAHAPGSLQLTAWPHSDAGWADVLPHAHVGEGTRLAVLAPGDRVPDDAEVVIARSLPGGQLPPGCAAVLTVADPTTARLEHAGHDTAVRVEAVSRLQAAHLAARLAARAERTLDISRAGAGPLPLAPLIALAPPAVRGGLPAVIGTVGGEPALVDLVTDGPHAVVAGVTGAGKSELLITWILALCATHTTDQVTFLLADFKGGTAFDGLRAVPHVTGVITDLDGSGARRAIESLRAELRRREAAVANAGARDILDARVQLPRLVVVVDEFAALLGDHPELHAVFADIAARGRALGIHLVLGTQRATGVIRDNLLANCPLRVSLRVTDAADSRMLLGTDAAARLPGGPAGRGSAFVLRAGDAVARRVRIALSGPDDVAAATAASGSAPRRPWLPSLPDKIDLAELRPAHADPGGIVLGLADEPHHQRQNPIGLAAHERTLLVLGGPRAGVSNVLDLVAEQAPGAVVRVPADPEGLWDAVTELSHVLPAPGTVVLVDDLDAMAVRLPAEYAHAALELLETILRRAPADGVLVVAGAHRVTGVVTRLGDLFERRLLLRYATRIDHAAAGGDPATFQPGSCPGRGRLGDVEVQVALAMRRPDRAAATAAAWQPSATITGFVARRSPSARRAVQGWEAAGARAVNIDDHAASPVVPDRPLVVVGEPEDWQRQWRLLSEVRGAHDLVVDSACGPELRMLAGVRSLPPYCEPGRGRAWLISAGAEPVRIVLPEADLRPIRRADAP
jgi:S-DNA-T family DNA segregation ATPase FtsK/SpoIIIE